MIAQWFKGMDPEEKQRRKDYLLANRKVLLLAKEIAEKQLRDLHDAMDAKALFDSPSWPYIQAEMIGRQRALKEMIQLLTIEEETQ